ncbi:PhosphoLipase D-like protein [Phytophthora palmivora]|uniref:PhosphoLipase D-like protein n=1 Tax=Phytophthora palmivora TaxID=4796 RepID=A0A2P4XM80_9STRA|nr:PhosphoLipase D-like protein [Phytophthora palmivora]
MAVYTTGNKVTSYTVTNEFFKAMYDDLSTTKEGDRVMFAAWLAALIPLKPDVDPSGSKTGFKKVFADIVKIGGHVNILGWANIAGGYMSFNIKARDAINAIPVSPLNGAQALYIFDDRLDDTLLDFNNPVYEDIPPLNYASSNSAANLGNQSIQITRTFSCTYNHFKEFAPNGENSLFQTRIKAIKNAKNFIYIEDQYFVFVPELLDALLEVMPTIQRLVVGTKEQTNAFTNAGYIKYLYQMVEPIRSKYPDKFKIYTTKPDRKLLIHTKLVINDDVYLSIGSANWNRRSMTADSELNAEVVDVAVNDFLHSPSDEITEILLIYGPCSFMRSTWTGGEITKADLLRDVHNLAVEDDISLVTHESNHEGTILDWLLNAKENEIIVLCWVGRLSDSPTILRAFELINNRVIVISPIGVNHGTLPPTVVGVLSGFGQLSGSCLFYRTEQRPETSRAKIAWPHTRISRETPKRSLQRQDEQVAAEEAKPRDGGAADVPTLPVLRRPNSDDRCWLLNNVHKLPKIEAPRPLSRAHLSSQELFLSVVMEWQKAEPLTDTASDGYTTPSSDDSEFEAASPPTKSKRVDDVSPTSVHNMTPLRLDYVTEPVKMIGAYTPAARRVLLQKYMAKRARRLSQHKVRYGVRKTLANARPRVKGRFVKTMQPLTAAAVEAQQAQQQQQA